MVDITLVSGVVTSLKTAMDIGRTVKEINDLSEVRGKVIEMQDLILGAQSSAMAAQSQLFELLHESSELKKKAADIDAWKEQASRYRLTDYGKNTFAYELRKDASGDEPIHRICPACFEGRKRSILQFKHRSGTGQDCYGCAPCGQDYYLGEARESSSYRLRDEYSSWV